MAAGAATIDLRRNIDARAGRGTVRAVDGADKAPINQYEVAGAVDAQVSRLQVAVDVACRMYLMKQSKRTCIANVSVKIERTRQLVGNQAVLYLGERVDALQQPLLNAPRHRQVLHNVSQRTVRW